MKKSLLFIALLFGSAIAVNAQDRERYVGLDNFNTARGVKVYVPQVEAKPIKPANKKTTNALNKTSVVAQKTKKTPKLLVRLTSYQSTVGSLDLPEFPQASKNYATTRKATGGALGGFSTGDSVIDSYILNSCRRYGVDPLLIYAQMHQESSFKLRAVSYKGARGLMQLMPATAARFGVTDIYNPQQNIDAGVKYMRWLLDTFGQDVDLALAGYNAGEGAVIKYGNVIPPYQETQEYVRRISNRYALLRDPNAVNLAKSVRIPAAKQKVQPENSKQQMAKLQKPAAPLSIYEQSVSVERMPDGSMQLVSR